MLFCWVYFVFEFVLLGVIWPSGYFFLKRLCIITLTWYTKLIFPFWEVTQLRRPSPPLPTQSTVLPVPTRYRGHACIKMRTALPANTKTRPSVVSMLVQRRWRWANIETALGQMLAFAGLHTGVCLHPPLRHHNILASRSGYF